MNPVDISNILLNENGYFYKKKKSKIAKSDIEKLFRQCLTDKAANKSYEPMIRASLFESGKEVAKYSVLIFDYQQRPSFMKADAHLWERKTGLFIILEHLDYLAVIRKNVSGAHHLYQIVEEIDYSILTNFMVTDTSKFEKIISSNLNTAENATQTKSAEGIDLKGVMSRFSISKQIINAVRLDNGGEKSSITLNTSRVNSLNIRNDFEPALFWLIKIIKLIDVAYKAPKTNSFVAGFAKPLVFSTEIKTLQPKFLFLRFQSVKDALEAGLISDAFTQDDKGKKNKVDLVAFLDSNSKLFSLTRYDARTYSHGNTSIKLNLNTISFRDPSFQEIQVSFGGPDSVSLQEYINLQQQFIVTFDKPDYAYTHRKIFQDHRLLEDLDIFMDTFIAEPHLAKVTSEKGKTTKTSKIFSARSIFGYLESKYLSTVDCMICDDMGTEWGDHISVKGDEITFYHSKYDKPGLSATKLEVVFGQAQKNLAFIAMTDEMVSKRALRWSSNYSKTSIPRIRKHDGSGMTPIESVKRSIARAAGSGNLQAKVYVVINFLSKSQLSASLAKVKGGETFHDQGVTLQILWFVNSLLASANDIGARFKIICRP
ncbi:hypothetical protein [Pedobacter ureilyticus]|uniref:Sporadically distributed protein, TIGR04141 family n=1 Tax=Pedobacter ureilyticus TaxID=1393051 RepID=A0ABW9JB47_9SPHI|nr:hypothetical protein [Pedobacter helvus]